MYKGHKIQVLSIFSEHNLSRLQKIVYLYFSTIPGNYAILTAAFNHHALPQCTFCNTSENAYNYAQPQVSIDHVFYKGHKFQVLPVILIKFSNEQITKTVQIHSSKGFG